MPSQFDDDGDLVTAPPTTKGYVPDVTPEVFSNPEMTASGQLACSLGVPFTTDKDSTE